MESSKTLKNVLYVSSHFPAYFMPKHVALLAIKHIVGKKHFCLKVNLFTSLLTYQTWLSHPNMFYKSGGIRYKNSIKYMKITTILQMTITECSRPVCSHNQMWLWKVILHIKSWCLVRGVFSSESEHLTLKTSIYPKSSFNEKLQKLFFTRT